MKRSMLMVTSLFALGMAGGAALAAESDATSPTNAAAKDYGKLSINGHRAFDEIQLARLAIFDGQPAQATKLVADAQQAFAKANTEDTAFMKAESELHAPANANAGAPAATAATAPIRWVPVDGQFVLGEALAPAGRQTGAVDAANQSLHQGQPAKARDALRVASVNADFILTVAPANSSMADLSRASQLLAAHDDYSANQALREAVDGVRFDSVDVQGTPAPARMASTAAHQSPATKQE